MTLADLHDLHLGDCLEVMATLPDESIDAVVTDPPYGLEFMGKTWDRLGDVGQATHQGFEQTDFKGFTLASYNASGNVKCRKCNRWKWDHEGRKCDCAAPDFANLKLDQSRRMQAWHEAWARQAFRLLKPGGHLLAFGGTRTYHRLACAIEDAGFEIRDCLVWGYASGFPKSLNLPGGLGTALKPAWEPIVMARKPLRGTVAANVLEYGTGALNIDGTRIRTSVADAQAMERANTAGSGRFKGDEWAGGGWPAQTEQFDTTRGRWPANIVLTDPIFDGGVDGVVGGGPQESTWALGRSGVTPRGFEDTGTYSRFFELKRYNETCVRCGLALDAELSTAPDETPSSGAPSAAPTSLDGMPASSTDPATQAPNPGTSTTTGSGGKSSPSEALRPTTESRSNRRPASKPDAISQPDPARSAASPEIGTTTTTTSRYLCVTCAVAITSPSTSGRLDQPNYPRWFLIPKEARSGREPLIAGQLIKGGTGLHDDDNYRKPGERKANHTAPLPRENLHPTVKPLELMRHLIRLVTPPGGTCLDPFLGSGTTAIACEMEGFAWIGIEKEPEYVEIAKARLNGVQRGLGLDVQAPTRKRSGGGPATSLAASPPQPPPGFTDEAA